MPPVIPNYDLGLLITLDIGLALLGLILTFVGAWAILRQGIRSQEIAERIDLRLRRQFADVDRELQEIKERLR